MKDFVILAYIVNTGSRAASGENEVFIIDQNRGADRGHVFAISYMQPFWLVKIVTNQR